MDVSRDAQTTNNVPSGGTESRAERDEFAGDEFAGDEFSGARSPENENSARPVREAESRKVNSRLFQVKQ